MIMNEADTYGIGWNYHLLLPNWETIEMPWEEIETLREAFLADFEEIEVQRLGEFYSEFFTNGTDWRYKTLNRNALITFFNEWSVE